MTSVVNLRFDAPLLTEVDVFFIKAVQYLFLKMSEFTISIDEEMPLTLNMSEKETLRNLGQQITNNIIDYLKPNIQHLIKVSAKNS